jgi:hypothetical protein
MYLMVGRKLQSPAQEPVWCLPKAVCEQALVLLVDKIKEAWRSNKVLSLISFDVKGAYNRVPENIVRWIRSFCTNRSATVVVNGEETAEASIEYPGLPQGSPLAPVLYIFFNAGLVDKEFDRKSGSIGFVDDYIRWTVGATIETNMEELQGTVIPRALQWVKDSGATFEPDKDNTAPFYQKHNRDPTTIPSIASRKHFLSTTVLVL